MSDAEQYKKMLFIKFYVMNSQALDPTEIVMTKLQLSE